MPQRRTSPFRALASESRLVMLHALQRSEVPLGVEDMAEEAGVHVNTAREHLERLVEAGFVTRSIEHRATRGRPRVLYASVAREAGGDFEERFRAHLREVTLAHLAGDGGAPVADDRGRVLNQLAALETHFDELRLNAEVDVTRAVP
ncbi:helix-turn-helix domain-containing protein [Cellulomonas bogoriensis]|uniref:Transcriptional regulator n=1 Tax=Cellulomonas bogoriensis 69B4 = DSM 16987 TaxID=1386082 RepID=A0A0A0C075_9CELL|nr:winged helix-turn-helix domain-containing protein [Cellulomonas bogoriensis]KGM14068.1 transcriptional regulator [Cellulomonas bogoriensis 69B4 = DSM 16987]